MSWEIYVVYGTLVVAPTLLNVNLPQLHSSLSSEIEILVRSRLVSWHPRLLDFFLAHRNPYFVRFHPPISFVNPSKASG
jgi:hypothetical protein